MDLEHRDMMNSLTRDHPATVLFDVAAAFLSLSQELLLQT